MRKGAAARLRESGGEWCEGEDVVRVLEGDEGDGETHDEGGDGGDGGDGDVRVLDAACAKGRVMGERPPRKPRAHGGAHEEARTRGGEDTRRRAHEAERACACAGATRS